MSKLIYTYEDPVFGSVSTPPGEYVEYRQMTNEEPPKVFDWKKAAEIIAEREPEIASAGLAEDWFWTSGPIWEGDDIADPKYGDWMYLMSTWATPIIHMEFKDGSTDDLECWVYQKDVPLWDEHTYWPQSAVDTLLMKRREFLMISLMKTKETNDMLDRIINDYVEKYGVELPDLFKKEDE